MKNSYAGALCFFAVLLMIGGFIAGIIMIVGSQGIPGVAFMFVSFFGGVLYLTIAKISSDLTESITLGEKNAKNVLFLIWYQEWGYEIANAIYEGKIIEKMTKEQVIDLFGNPSSSARKENIEILYYQNKLGNRIRNLIFENGILLRQIISRKGLKLAFDLKLGMTKAEVEDVIGTPEQEAEQEITLDGAKRRVITCSYSSVLRDMRAEKPHLRLYFDKNNNTLVKKE